jgi:predicted small lipoprotein YifL
MQSANGLTNNKGVNTMKTTTIISLVFTLVACGQQPNYSEPTLTDKQDKKAENTDTQENKKTNDVLPPQGIDGYISNAFDLTVDGERYTDSEDFYTKELDRLTESAVEAGYEDWNLDFDAQIGLVDLKYGMTVFVGSPSRKGFAGQTTVASDASFHVHVPGSRTARELQHSCCQKNQPDADTSRR